MGSHEIYLGSGIGPDITSVTPESNIGKRKIAASAKNPIFEKAMGEDFIGSLSPREIEFLDKRSLIDTPTLGKIGKSMGVTREGVRQIENRIIKKIEILEKGEELPSHGNYREDVTKEEVTRLFLDERKTVDDIAAQFKCSGALVYIRLKEADVILEKRGRKRKDINENAIAWRYVVEKRSAHDIACMFQVSEGTILDRLITAGIQIRVGRSSIVVDESKLIRSYIDERKTLNEVGKLFGCSGTTIAKRLKSMGIEIRKTGPRGPRKKKE